MFIFTTLWVIAMLAMVFFFGFVIGDLRATFRWEKKYNEFRDRLNEIEKDLAVGGTDE